MSDDSTASIVSIAFRKVVFSGNYQLTLRKVGEPVLEIEVLGNKHNLENIGELLFEHYLREVLNEELYEHMWRFEPSESGESGQALNPNIPILSNDMHTFDPFSGKLGGLGSASTPYKVKSGSDLLFKYDEGTPTYLMATIESITPLPDGKTVENYPAKKVDPLEHVAGEKRKRLAETAVRTITMDAAYPSLCHRLLSEHKVRLEIGNGSDPMPSKAEAAWARIWGGGPQAAYNRSLECYHAFDDMDEAWLCFDRAIQKQISPNGPGMIKEKECKDRKTGEVYYTEEDGNLDIFGKFSIVANVLPAAAPAALFRDEMMEDFSFSTYTPKDEDPVLRSWSRYCFNFALEKDWNQPQLKQEPNQVKNEQQEGQRVAAPNFSFTKQFPQCTAWLTHPCGTSHWMFLERGVLHAVKGKHNPKTGEKVVHRTLKHTSLHAMFTDMEDQLVLPKAWKIKKNA